MQAMTMRGSERGGRGGRNKGPEARAGAPTDKAEDPNTFVALADLARLVGRSGAPQLRLRLVLSILLTIAGKGLGVLAPLVLGAAVNHLSRGAGGGRRLRPGLRGLRRGLGLRAFLSSAIAPISDVVFAPVRSAAQRRTAAETFAHALSLSLDFHQTKRSGSLSRTMDRGARSVDFLLRILAFNLVPTGVELVLAAGVLAGKYDWRFGAVAMGGGDLRRPRPSPCPTGGSSIAAK
jgi:ABC-type multidrug transport system fused ATPase/permease subunit